MATSNFKDQCAIFWLDSEANNSEENLSTQQQLLHSFNNVEIFEDENSCQQAIRAKAKQPVFLIVSGRLSRKIVPAIDTLEQVKAIFIYCMDKSRHTDWAKGFPKIKDIVTELEKLVSQIQTNLKELKKKKPPTDPVHEVAYTPKPPPAAISLLVDDDKNPSHLDGYEKVPLGSLEDAVAPLAAIVDDIEQMVWIVKQNATNPEDGLTSDESASIALLTMEWFPKEKSFAAIINEVLCLEDRGKLKPWFRYLKLVFKALSKLPSTTKTVYQGTKEDLTRDYSKSTIFTCWEFMDCTGAIESLDNENFGKTGRRTLFTIQCQSAKDIRRHSNDPSKDQILLLPGRQFQVISCLNPDNDLKIIQLKELQPLYSFE